MAMSADAQLSSVRRGMLAEEQALQYLLQRGLVMVERNFRCRYGEIDLIMRDNNTIIFVEVRSRKSDAFLDPMESIDYAKRNKLIRASELFMQKLTMANEYDWRFDVITLNGAPPDVRVNWLKAAL